MSLESKTNTASNVIKVLRDGTIFGILFMLVGCPKVANQRLVDAGITKFEGAGLTWEKEIKEAKKQTEDAIAENEAVKKELEQSKKQFEGTLAKVDALVASNPSIKAESVQLIKSDIRKSSAKLGSAQKKIDATVKSQKEVVSSQDALLDNIRLEQRGPERR